MHPDTVPLRSLRNSPSAGQPRGAMELGTATQLDEPASSDPVEQPEPLEPLDPSEFEDREAYELQLFVPERSDEARKYANSLLRAGKRERAAAAYKKIMAFDNLLPAERAKLFSHLALVRIKQWRWDDVLKVCGAVLKIEPGNAKALYRRALARHALKDFEEALVEIEKGRAVANQATREREPELEGDGTGLVDKFDALEKQVHEDIARAKAAAALKEESLRNFASDASPRPKVNPVRLAELASPRFLKEVETAAAAPVFIDKFDASSSLWAQWPILTCGRNGMPRSGDPEVESVVSSSILPSSRTPRSSRAHTSRTHTSQESLVSSSTLKSPRTARSYAFGRVPRSTRSSLASRSLRPQPMIYPWLPEPMQPSGSRRVVLTGSPAVDRWTLETSNQRDARAIATARSSYSHKVLMDPWDQVGKSLIENNAKRAMQEVHKRELIEVDNLIMQRNIRDSVGSMPPPNLKALQTGARQAANSLQVGTQALLLHGEHLRHHKTGTIYSCAIHSHTLSPAVLIIGRACTFVSLRQTRRRRDVAIRKANVLLQKNMERQPGVVVDQASFPGHDHWLAQLSDYPVVLGKPSPPLKPRPKWWDPGHVDYSEARQ